MILDPWDEGRFTPNPRLAWCHKHAGTRGSDWWSGMRDDGMLYYSFRSEDAAVMFALLFS